ncbi:MAG: M14 family zinc carboxypeptidase [Candidatus Thalassarchaeaceae archaeon]|nr:M14 family zinc carboxypeptidase [Candidatus Thalassarchaeaceae archaeon]
MTSQDASVPGRKPTSNPGAPVAAMLLPFLLSMLSPVALAPITEAQVSDTGTAPEDIWSTEYAQQIFPWGPHGDEAQLQFREYHDYFSMKQRMQTLAAYYPDFLQFHEGLLGGLNARGEFTSVTDYEGWYYNHPSPWMKITADVRGGEYNDFVGDDGNYEDRPDVMLVGNHHAREWMSVQVPMFFLETLAYYYGKAGVDNDGDGLIDEDGWDGIDNDGDCLSLNASFQDSNNDGNPCGPGDLGVDEDFSEQFITDMVNTREIYLIPMLNTDGHRYDREEYCGETAWENCYRSGWRKNLRDNTHTGITPIPDVDEAVDPGCDGVDLNRNYQFEWGAPLGATGPLFPGFCYADGPNNDVYNGPVDTVDQDEDGRLNEDHVDGKDDDADGIVDEDWMGGNSEPETKFIQDMTEMNDDDGDSASDFKSTLTWHSYSELVLWPWGHCSDCYTPDDEYLVYHGQMMGQMTDYAAMQSSDLYPTTGDFCDWHYGVHNSYCYTMEIGNAFHEFPEDIAHISVRNLGVPFYMVEMADDPQYRAVVGIQNTTATQWLQEPMDVDVPSKGDIPVGLCLDPLFPFTPDVERSHLMWRFVEPTRQQNDFGPTDWVEVPWQKSGFSETSEQCTLLDGSNGTHLVGLVPLPDTSVGKIQYKAMLGTTNGAFPFSYPTVEEGGNYYELSIPYRAGFGDAILSILMFLVIATFVWGGLGFTLREMFSEEERILGMPLEEEPMPEVIKPGKGE